MHGANHDTDGGTDSSAGTDADGGGHPADGVSRRTFVKAGAIAGTGALVMGASDGAAGQSTVEEACGSGDSIYMGDAMVINNDWSTSDEPQDANQCVFRNDDGSYGWSWNRGETDACAEHCPDYPEVLIGHKPWSDSTDAAMFPVQIGSIDELVVELDVDNGATGEEWNLALEWWFTEQAPPIGGGQPTHEIMLLLEWADGHDKGELVEEAAATDRFGNQIDLWQHVTDRTDWSFYIFRVAGNEQPRNIDLTVIYDYLYSVKSEDPYGFPDSLWMTGVEVGNETWDNSSGTTTVRDFDVLCNGQTATSGVDDNFEEVDPTPTSTPTPTATPTPTPDTTPPAAPSDLSGTMECDPARVELTWSAPSDDTGLDHYNVYANGSLDHQVAAGTTSTSVTDLNYGEGNDFYVTAVDGAGNESSGSNTASVLYPLDYCRNTGENGHTDVDDDGQYEDLNGNGRLDSDDVVTYFEEMDGDQIQNNVDRYDYNENGRIDFDDVVTLFEEM